MIAIDQLEEENMSPRISAEMYRAMELIKAGATRTSAARQTGLRTTSITRSRLYQEWIAKEAEKQAADKKPSHYQVKEAKMAMGLDGKKPA